MKKINFLWGFSLALSALVCITACRKDEDAPKYNVKVEAAEGGSVDGQCGEYYEGEMLEFKAIPNDGYFFAGWSDSTMENPRMIFTGNNDIDIKAIFISAKATIDLGLTSGTQWAVCNVGASLPWEFGDYIAWGETAAKSYYDWNTYKYCEGTDGSFTKYCNTSYYGKDGFTDNLSVLEATDDAATTNWGAEYATPTIAEWAELVKECYWVRTSDYYGKNVSGYIVYKAKTNSDKGKKVYIGEYPSESYTPFDKHIFLPAAYCYHLSSFWTKGCDGAYWSATLQESPNTHIAKGLAFWSNSIEVTNGGSGRATGLSVRPVRRK